MTTSLIDIIKLQEVFLQRINDQETKFLERLKSYQDFNDKRVSEIESELNLKNTRVVNLQDNMHSLKIQIDKVPDLEKKLQLNVEDTFQHKCKIKNIEKDLSAACTKYDKMYFENLVLPGVIGDCGNTKFKNVREYINVSLYRFIVNYRIILKLLLHCLSSKINIKLS